MSDKRQVCKSHPNVKAEEDFLSCDDEVAVWHRYSHSSFNNAVGVYFSDSSVPVNFGNI